MNETESGYIKETDNMGREKFWEDIGRLENSGIINDMTTEDKIVEESKMCCAECTCENPHRSKPIEE